jgi:hypothetical protein
MTDSAVEFQCAEFDGCDFNYCAYEGEEDCHWLNLPVEDCQCQVCMEKQ